MSKEEKTATNNQWTSSAVSLMENCSGGCCDHCKGKAKKTATNNQWTSTNS